MSVDFFASAPLVRFASSICRKFQRVEKRVGPSGCFSVDSPVDVACTMKGLYFAGKYPELGMPPEFSAMNAGRTSDGVRESCDSSDTTDPMCGAIAPVAPVGLRE